MIFTRIKYNLPYWFPRILDRLIYKIDRFSWKLQHRFNPNHQYHIVRTGLEPGYYDIDILMEAVMVKFICRFVEVEIGGVDRLKEIIQDKKLENIDSSCDETALEAYEWFTVDLPKQEEIINNHWKGVNFYNINHEENSKIFDMENNMYHKSTEMMVKMVEIRGGLWT